MPTVNLEDDRRVARGWGRLVPAFFWVAGVLTFCIGIWQLFYLDLHPIGPRLVNVIAGVIYLVSAAGLTHNGRRMRMIAWVFISMALAGPVLSGLRGLGEQSVDLWSPWENFGVQVWFISVVLPLVGLVWMWISNPRRIVEIAEGVVRG